MYKQLLAIFRSFLHPSIPQTEAVLYAQAAAAVIKAVNDKAIADEMARTKPANAVKLAAGNDDYVRANYYKKADFARYQAARVAVVPDATGLKPWVNPGDFDTPAPSVEEWATWTPEKKALGHVDV